MCPLSFLAAVWIGLLQTKDLSSILEAKLRSIAKEAKSEEVLPCDLFDSTLGTPEELTKALWELVRNCSDEPVRYVAIRILSIHHLRFSFQEGFVDILQHPDSSSARMREKAVLALHRSPIPSVVEVFRGIAERDPDPKVRFLAAEGIGTTPADTPSRLAALEQLLRLSDSFARKGAILGLMFLRRTPAWEEATGLLRRRLKEEKDPTIALSLANAWFHMTDRDTHGLNAEIRSATEPLERAALVHALAPVDPSTARKIIDMLLTSEMPPASNVAMLSLANIPGTSGIQRLNELLASGTSDQQELAFKVLLGALFSNPHARDALRGFARDQLNDPRVAPVLKGLSLCEDPKGRNRSLFLKAYNESQDISVRCAALFGLVTHQYWRWEEIVRELNEIEELELMKCAATLATAISLYLEPTSRGRLLLALRDAALRSRTRPIRAHLATCISAIEMTQKDPDFQRILRNRASIAGYLRDQPQPERPAADPFEALTRRYFRQVVEQHHQVLDPF